LKEAYPKASDMELADLRIPRTLISSKYTVLHFNNTNNLSFQ
jgi:hypothetical protein